MTGNSLGLISANLFRHVEAKHDGKFNEECFTCTGHFGAHQRHCEELSLANNGTFTPFLTGQELVESERRWRKWKKEVWS